jgi:hypothetical protein
MIFERTADKDLIKRILTTDGIWEMITDHGMKKEDYEPDESWLYVVGKVEEKEIGIVLVHATPDGFNKCHVQIVPEYRKEHSKEFGIKGMEWLWGNTDYEKLVATIPEIYPNVVRYALNQGFKLMGKMKRGYENNGIICDKLLLAIERGG